MTWSLPPAPGPSLVTFRCCDALCWAEDLAGYGPCRGRVEVIDEDWDEEHDEHTWIHGCEAHPSRGGPEKTP